MIDAETLFKNDAYKNISDEQKDLLKELLIKIEGKSGFEALPLLVEYSKKAPKGVEYTKEEETAMLNAFLEALPESEQGTFGNLIKMFEKFKGK